ncbi:hypothetical protein Q8W71_15415 [Methylobacterium sp. NEAU 140]|uniref:hypothetical protein n=1 Tax=Methylobacterium sp. NEAU 140 TaxID=3064945 RepID=UPI002735C585|nr:hypothetical protein [Methylobacterium sp. NEAU 140]MDP4024019.1 hypothetical protein [Methylobacterium sp. NEAU 140]
MEAPMPDLPVPETPSPDGSDPPPAEPMTNAPIPLAEDEPGVGLSRPNDEPDDPARDTGDDAGEGGRVL